MLEELKSYTREIIDNYLEKYNYDGMVITSYENCYYLSGVFLYYNAVIIKKGEDPILLVKYIDRTLAKELSYLTDIRAYSPYPVSHKEDDIIIGDYPKAISTVLKDLGLSNKKICIADYWSVLRPYLGLKENLPDAEIIVSEPFLEYVRCTKQPVEINYIRESVALLDKALDDCVHLLKDGVSENVLAGEIAKSIWKNGGELTHLIIANGKNSLLPHSKITDQPFRNGENVVLDFVSYKNGYYGALTRTFVIGEQNPEKDKVFKAILETADIVYKSIKPGMPICSIAKLALEEFKKRGYGDKTKHAFGHAIGTFQHETPILNTTETRILEKGMVFCFEPGIYIPSLGGFRLGDLVVLTDEGFEKISDSYRNLNILNS